MKMRSSAGLYTVVCGIIVMAIFATGRYGFCHQEPVPQGVIRLLELTGIDCPHTLEDIVAATQKHWLRKQGTERWDIEEHLSEEVAAEIYDIGKSLGYIGQIKPTQTTYKYCCVHGGTMGRMIDRVRFAEELVESGICFEKIILLSGERQLGEHDITPEFAELPEDEAAGMLLIYEELEGLDMLRSIPHVLVSAPAITTSQGTVVRPSTQHTLRTWINDYKPEDGACLFVSNQPYVQYQHNVAQVELPEGLIPETVGSAASPSYAETPMLLLDTVARMLYQELMSSKTKGCSN